MEDISKATTQYGDLEGTVSLDGFDGPFLRELAKYSKMPAGYTPVGVSIHGTNNERRRGPLDMDVLGTDADLSGVTGDELNAHFRSEQEVKVFRFPITLPVDELYLLVKRLSVVIFLRALHGKKVVALEDEA